MGKIHHKFEEPSNFESFFFIFYSRSKQTIVIDTGLNLY